MASDLQTEPKDVPALLTAARANPDAVITTTRWQAPGQSKVRLLCNWIFRKFFWFLYNTKLTDLTFGYRVYPTALVQGIQWQECRQPFLVESMVKPLRLGVKALEVPTSRPAWTEGESQHPFFRNLAYFRTCLKVRFSSRDSLVAREPEWLPFRITARHVPQHQAV
jgi:hypothetical protein